MLLNFISRTTHHFVCGFSLFSPVFPYVHEIPFSDDLQYSSFEGLFFPVHFGLFFDMHEINCILTPFYFVYTK